MKLARSTQTFGSKNKLFLNLLILTLFINLIPEAHSASPKDCAAYNHPQYQAEYRACLKLEITASAKTETGEDCKNCFLHNESNPWIEAMSFIMPSTEMAALHGMKYSAKSQEAWRKSWEDYYNSPENIANRDEFDKVLAEHMQKGKAPLAIYDLQKLTTLVTDYKILKANLDPKDLPTFEEFKKMPDAYITRDGWHMYAHKKDPCIDYKQEKYMTEYAKCRSLNEASFKIKAISGMYVGMGPTSVGGGITGGIGVMPNVGLGFCTPNANESECATSDGRVYVLSKGTNQLGRGLKIKKIEVNDAQSKMPQDAAKK